AHGAYRARGFRSRLLRAGERNLHLYDRRGEGTAPPVLLVHGMGGNAAGFLPIVRAVLRASRRVVALELPGHGRSRLGSGEAPAIGEDVLRAIDRPVLILWGEGDRILPGSSVDYFRTHLPKATVEMVPGSGHLPMVERSRLVAARIARFLAEL